jgi:hypothetical protein
MGRDYHLDVWSVRQVEMHVSNTAGIRKEISAEKSDAKDLK